MPINGGNDDCDSRFKLLLRPPSSASTTSSTDIPKVSLPRGKDIISVYSDFYRYLFSCARTYIQESTAGGVLVWNSVKDNIDFVLSHPNGWEGAPQSAMRKAAIMAELIPDTPAGHDRITFVSEGEASFHYCIATGQMVNDIRVSNTPSDRSR